LQEIEQWLTKKDMVGAIRMSMAAAVAGLVPMATAAKAVAGPASVAAERVVVRVAVGARSAGFARTRP
jgi:hypothetical protein